MNAFNQISRLVVFIALQDIDLFTPRPLHTLNASFGNKIRKSSGHCFSSFLSSAQPAEAALHQ